jgi:hypothetical protein
VANPPADFDGTALIGELLARINENWIATDRPVARSCENWRFAKMLAIDADNRSPEKRLEKAIVLAADDSWANQIPTASGLLDSSGRQCNIDLAKRQSSEYWLFELKCESDHPISSAMQILRYGLLYVFWRDHIDELMRSIERPPLLAATTVHLRVLAPTNYYVVPNAEKPFAWLEGPLSAGIQTVAQERGIAMDFQFDVLQEAFFTRLYG